MKNVRCLEISRSMHHFFLPVTRPVLEKSMSLPFKIPDEDAPFISVKIQLIEPECHTDVLWHPLFCIGIHVLHSGPLHHFPASGIIHVMSRSDKAEAVLSQLSDDCSDGLAHQPSSLILLHQAIAQVCSSIWIRKCDVADRPGLILFQAECEAVIPFKTLMEKGLCLRQGSKGEPGKEAVELPVAENRIDALQVIRSERAQHKALCDNPAHLGKIIAETFVSHTTASGIIMETHGRLVNSVLNQGRAQPGAFCVQHLLLFLCKDKLLFTEAAAKADHCPFFNNRAGEHLKQRSEGGEGERPCR